MKIFHTLVCLTILKYNNIFNGLSLLRDDVSVDIKSHVESDQVGVNKHVNHLCVACVDSTCYIVCKSRNLVVNIDRISHGVFLHCVGVIVEHDKVYHYGLRIVKL